MLASMNRGPSVSFTETKASWMKKAGFLHGTRAAWGDEDSHHGQEHDEGEAPKGRVDAHASLQEQRSLQAAA